MRRILPLILLLAACAPTRETGGPSGPDPGPDLPQINYGWSYGECWGESRGELIVSADSAISFEIRGWENETYLTVTGTAHDATMDAIEAAYDALDRRSLDSVYGCPDCNDGGAEYVLFLDDIDPPQSDWEAGSAPAELQAISDALRALADAMHSCRDGEGYDEESCLASFVDGDDTEPEPVPPPPG